jgi:hypothetical protein
LLPFSKGQLRIVWLSRVSTDSPDYSEFLVDATFQKCDARAYLHGAAHEGFFNSLFPTFTRLGLRLSPHGVLALHH